MTSAGEIINGSLRLLGVLAEGETPSAGNVAGRARRHEPDAR